MKKTIERFTASVVTLAMTLGCVPAVFAEENNIPFDAIPFETQDVDDDYGRVSFLTMSAPTEEGKSYSIKLRRTGDLSTAETVEVTTVDTTAVYGKDYTIAVPDAKTKKLHTDGTLLERMVEESKKEETPENAEEALAQITDNQQTSNDNKEYEELLKIAEEDEAKENENVDEENNITKSPHQSELARLKEEQTGVTARVVRNEELSSGFEAVMNELMLDEITESMGEILGNSSVTEVEFAEGEAEKEVYINIADDDESEGNEVFQLYLGAVSEGLEVGTVNYAAITIVDDEPEAESIISFKKATYIADEEKVEVTVERKDALYLVSSVQLKTVESGNAVAGENFAPLNSTLTFTPLEEEYVFDLPVIPSDEETTFEIAMDDFKGATAGKNDSVTVIIPSKAKAKKAKALSKNAEDLSVISEDSGTVDKNLLGNVPVIDYDLQDISINGTTYTVDKNKTVDGTDNFPIIKNNTLVGEYIPLTSDLNVSTWTQGTVPNDRNMSAGRHWNLFWNSYPLMGNDGRVGMDAIVDRSYPERFSNWYCYYNVYKYSRNAGGDELFFDVDMRWQGDDTLGSNNRVKPGKETSGFLEVYMPSAEHTMVRGGVSRFGCAIGGEGNTKYGVDIRGLVCLYREFRYKVTNPPTIKTRRASDGQRVVDTLPAIATDIGGEGVCRYNNVLNITTTKPDGGEYYGNLKGFNIKLYAGEINKEFTMSPMKDSKGTVTHAITIDNDFLEAYGGLKKQSGKNPGTVTIQPVYDTKPSILELPSATTSIGNFNDPELAETAKKGENLNLIYGDRVDLTATCNMPGYDLEGIRIIAKNSARDTANICDYIEMNEAVLKNFLINKPYYRIYPVFTQKENHINVKLTAEAEKYVKVMDTIPESKLPNVLKNSGGYVLNTSVGETTVVDNKYTPKTGGIYTIKLAQTDNVPQGKAVRAVFTRFGSNDKINGLTYDFSASGMTEENQIYVDVKLVDETELALYAITGITTTSGRIIRSADVETKTRPIGDVSITAGGEYLKIKNPNGDTGYNVVRQSNVSNEKDGTFAVAGVKACQGDTITIRLTNGYSEWVDQIKTIGNDKSIDEFEYFDYSKGTEVTGECYKLSAGEMPLPMITVSQPYVKNVTYELEQEAAFDNTIWITDKTITMHAEVEPNGRKIKTVLFTKVSLDGSVIEYRSELDKNDEYKVVFNKVEQEFKDGDTMYVSIIDEEKLVSTYSYENDNGETVIGKIESELIYPMEYTGLTFARLHMPPDMHTFSFKGGVKSPDIKKLGAIGSDLSAGTGKLEWAPVQVDGFSGYKLSLHFCPSFFVKKNDKLLNGSLSGQLGYDDYIKKRNEMSDKLRRGEGLDGREENFRREITNQLNDEDITQEEMDRMIQNYAAKDAAQKAFDNISVKINVMLALDFLFIEKISDTGGKSYNLISGGVLIGASTSVSKNFIITAVCGVPVYATLGVDAATKLSFMWTPDPAYDMDKDAIEALENLGDLTFNYIDFMFSITGKAGVGLGMPGILGARGVIRLGFNIANGSQLVPVIPTPTPTPPVDLSKSTPLPTRVPAVKESPAPTEIATTPTPKPTAVPMKRVNSGAVKGSLGGSLEIDMVVMTFTIDLGTWNFKIADWDPDKKVSMPNPRENDEVVPEMLSCGTTDMSGFGKAPMVTSDFEQGKLNILLENAADRTKPALAHFDNGKNVLFFVGGGVDNTGKEHNALYYSVCNKEGVWGTTKAINIGNTKEETIPVISVAGNKAIVAWVEADTNAILSTDDYSSDKLKDVLNSTNIKYAEFDAETENIGDAEYVVCDKFMDSDVMPLYDEDGLAGVYYTKHDMSTVDDIRNLINQKASYSTLAFMPIKDGKPMDSAERLLDLSCEGIEDPLITDPTATITEYKGNKYGLLAYSIDEKPDDVEIDSDGNKTPTGKHKEIHLTITDIEKNREYAPLKITSNEVSDIEPSFVRFGDDLYLYWVSEGYKLCGLNISTLVKEAEALGVIDKLINSISDKEWYSLNESDLPDWYDYESGDNYWSYLGRKEITHDEFPIYSCDVDELKDEGRENKQASLSEYKILNYNDKSLYLIWTDATDEGREVFGKEYIPIADIKEESSECVRDLTQSYNLWSDTTKITKCGKAIDEITAVFNNNGDLDLCGNMFDIDGDKHNNMLVQYERIVGAILGIDEKTGINFGSYPREGELVEISYAIKNTGIRSIEKAESELWIDYADGTSECCSTDYSYDIAPSEVRNKYAYWYVKEGKSLEGAVARIVCSMPNNNKDIIRDNEFTKPVPYGANFKFSDLSTRFDRNKLYISGAVYNNGNAKSAPIKLIFKKTGENENNNDAILYTEYDLPAIEPGESIAINHLVSDFNSSCFNEYGLSEITVIADDGKDSNSTTVTAGMTSVYEINSGLGDGKSVELQYGASVPFSPVVCPKNASDSKLIYKSSDPAVAYVSDDGIITAMGDGIAEITVTAVDSFTEDKLMITVTGENPEPTPTPMPTSTPKPSHGGGGGGMPLVVKPTSEPIPTERFDDVHQSDWFYKAVNRMADLGIVNGMSERIFEPQTNITRAMFATMLFRLNGEIQANYAMSFEDVPEDSYYCEAVRWAAASGVVMGYNDHTFAPDDRITREQAATMLYRYATANDIDISVGESTNIISYSDFEDISEYAIPALQLAVGVGIMKGRSNNTINPIDFITRAETAQVLYNYIESK